MDNIDPSQFSDVANIPPTASTAHQTDLVTWVATKTDKRAPYDPSSGAEFVPTIFGPSFQVAGAFPNLTLVTADRAAFHAHRHLLLRVSQNAWGGLLFNPRQSIDVPESAVEAAVALHIAYGLPCLHLFPSLDTVEKAISMLIKYGVPVRNVSLPSMPLYQLLLSHAPFHPIEAYAIAAYYDLEQPAVAVSSHLLAYDTCQLSDELTVKMGPVYFKRLFDLHQIRRDALKAIVLKSPQSHPPILTCRDKERLTTAWAHAAAKLAWDTTNVSTYALQSAFEKAGRGIVCGECISVLRQRIQEVMQEWSAVPRNI
ncbi:hypothetical protein C8Q74DRAFT_723883 [Fomes fomentarius]|nr:hypothetical protein C8Q74DRAFT_723883 [Fomes fomentarius]